MGEANIFSTIDPRGYEVHLTKEQYLKHIIEESGHTTVPTQDIQRAVEMPAIIYQSSYLSNVDVYFAKTSSIYPPLYVKVAVAVNEAEKSGEVRTSFLSKTISGSINTEGGPKYIDYNNKL